MISVETRNTSVTKKIFSQNVEIDFHTCVEYLGKNAQVTLPNQNQHSHWIVCTVGILVFVLFGFKYSTIK